MILAIDPGTDLSAHVVFDEKNKTIREKFILPNDETLGAIGSWPECSLAI